MIYISMTTDTANTTTVISGLEISTKLQELARKQRMNTDTRRNIFFIIMTSEVIWLNSGHFGGHLEFFKLWNCLTTLSWKQKQKMDMDTWSWIIRNGCSICWKFTWILGRKYCIFIILIILILSIYHKGSNCFL